MARGLADIERDIEELSSEERAALLRALIARLDAPADVDVEEAWAAEVARRLKEIDEGTAKTVPGDAVLKAARSRLG